MINRTPNEIDGRRRIKLDNVKCAYCNVPLNTPGLKTDEDHAIGKKLVPKGTLAGQWNLILRVCKGCNQRKSALEDDLSAISMQPDAWGCYPFEHEDYIKEATRKANRSISKLTKKPVSKSPAERIIKASYSPEINAEFKMVAPPQVDWKRIHQLAFWQTAAFFYWLTYDRDKKIGGFFPGQFYHLNFAARRDWGNALMRGFMDTAINWEERCTSIGASGFFKLAIRKHPSLMCWSSALEWNESFRIISLFGEQEAAEAVALTLPPLDVTWIPQQDPGHFITYRQEIPLADEDDKLFPFERSALLESV